jgi:hypothetical protein
VDGVIEDITAVMCERHDVDADKSVAMAVGF